MTHSHSGARRSATGARADRASVDRVGSATGAVASGAAAPGGSAATSAASRVGFAAGASVASGAAGAGAAVAAQNLSDLEGRRCSQSGYTLLELMIALAISLLIIGPLMAWALLVMRQQPVEHDGMLRTAQSGLLGSMFPSDVSVAGQAWVSGMSEPWATDCAGGASAGGSVQLVMVSAGSTIAKVVYSVAPSPGEPGELSIWRRTCGAGSDDTLKSEQALFRGVRAGTTAVTCSSPLGDSPCREVALTTTPNGSNAAIELSATRRIDNSATSVDSVGNPLPVAVITLDSLDARTASRPMVGAFSATRSHVGSGRTIASYAWEFESDVVVSGGDTDHATAEFPSLAPGETNRDFTVRLTVTDDLGRSNTTFIRVSSSNLEPVAVISRIAPNPANVGDTVTFSALPVDGLPGSYDPDGAITSFDWQLTLPQADPESPPREVWLQGPTVSYTATAADVGEAMVRLSVTDAQLARAIASESFRVVDPHVSTTTSTTSTTIVDPASPVVASFTASTGANALVRDFDASATTGAGEGATYAWAFGDGTSGSGIDVSHTFASAGTYPVTLTVVASDGRGGSTSEDVNIVVGPLPSPARVRHNGTYVLWDPVAGAKRYLVDFEFSTPTDCIKQISNQAVGAGPNPSKAIPQNPCTNRNANGRARVGTDSGSAVTWSAWIAIPTINTPGTTTTTVVK